MHAYLQSALAGIPAPGRMGSETMGMYPMGAFQTGDGEYCLVQVSNELQWQRFCTVLAAQDLAADRRFATNPLRVQNRDVLRPLIQEHLRARTAREWEQLFIAAGVPASHVRGLDDVMADEQVRARNMIKPALLASGRELATWGMPVKMNEQLRSRTLRVPGVNEHQAEILAELDQVNAGQ